MNILRIADIVLTVALGALGVETLIRVKKSAGKQIEEIRKPLILRINIIMVLIVAVAALTIATILTNK